MTLEDYMYRERMEGKAEGRAEGLAEGEDSIYRLARKMREEGYSFDEFLQSENAPGRRNAEAPGAEQEKETEE